LFIALAPSPLRRFVVVKLDHLREWDGRVVVALPVFQIPPVHPVVAPASPSSSPLPPPPPQPMMPPAPLMREIIAACRLVFVFGIVVGGDINLCQ